MEALLLASFGQVPANSPHPGIDAYLRGDYDLAIRYFTQAIQREPGNSRIYNDRAVAYKAKGDFDKALRDFNEALRLDPHYGAAFSNRGMLFLAHHDYDLAIADFNDAIQLDSQNAAAYDGRGKAYLAKGDNDRAILDENMAIRIFPGKASAYKNRGEAYLAKGEREEAIADFDEAARLQPGIQSAAVSPVPAPAPTTDHSAALTAPVPAPITSAEGSGLPDKIAILGHELVLKDQKVEWDGSSLAEYIPSSSTWDNWTLLFGVWFFPGKNLDPVIMAERKAAGIMALKKVQPLCNVLVWKQADGKTAMVDFLETSKDFNSQLNTGLLEHNFWRYTKFENGIVAYQIARRFYLPGTSGDDLLAFIKGIAPLRSSLTTEINDPRLPAPVSAGSRASAIQPSI